MRTHTNDFKNTIKTMGRQVYATITYDNTTLTNDDIKSVNYNVSGDILKSVMRELTIDSITNIPLKTQISLNIGLLVNGVIEYINYGNFIVETSEKQEDTNSYFLTCYDKMLYAQKPYESLGVAYPITIRNYINAICTKIGLTFANASDTFANYNKQIPVELYLDSEGNSLDYTFRDVLDELAQVTASTICINDDDELEIRYLNDTNDTIDEEYLKDVNVNMGESFGAINTIVFSRSAGSDKIALSQPIDLPDENKIALEIADNQILNGLDRGDYLADILTQLYGLTYYLNDFDSTGILYYDICDKYNITIGENTYPCVMLNDEINVSQGIKETIFTELPQTSDTEYQYTDTQERLNSRTTLIVNKHERQIQSVVSQIGDRTHKTTTITQDIDTIESQVQNMPVITIENEGIGQIQLQDLAGVKVAGFRVHPTNQDILGLLVSDELIISDDLIIDNREIVFKKGNFKAQFDLPPLYYYNSNIYDEFLYDTVEERAYKIQRVSVDNQGNKSILNTPIEIDYEYKDIQLEEGNYNIYVATCPSAYIYAKGMIVNEYTRSFATKYEEESKRTQLANQIYDVVRKKVDNSEVVASLNLAIEEGQGVVAFKSNQFSVDSDNFNVDKYGNMECNNAKINGNLITANGVLTNLTFQDEIWSWFNENGFDNYGIGFVGFNTDTYIQNSSKSFMVFDIKIPDGFIVSNAKIHLKHWPTLWWNPDNTDNRKGSCKNMNIYIMNITNSVVNCAYNSDFGIDLGTYTFNPINDISQFSFSDTEYQEKDIEIPISIFGNNQNFKIAIMTTISTPSWSRDITTAYRILGPDTGIMIGLLEMIGYMKYNEETASTTLQTPLLGGGLLGGGLNQGNEEPLNVGEPSEEIETQSNEEESDI